MTMQWRNDAAGKRFAEMVMRGDGITAAEVGELLAMEGHNVTVEGPVVTVHPAQAPVGGVTITAANPGNAKARRRRRRRNAPNSQHRTSNMVAQSMAAWGATDLAMEKAIGEWEGVVSGALRGAP